MDVMFIPMPPANRETFNDIATHLMNLSNANVLHSRVIAEFDRWCKANLPVSIAEMEAALLFSKVAHDEIERGGNPFA
jgi:hypothetical protein